MVEFALIAPIFFIVVLGMIDGTRAIFAYNAISNASREGARYGIVHGGSSASPVGPGVNETALKDHVKQFTKAFSPSDLTVTPSWPSGSNAIGSKVKVDMAYKYHPMFGALVGIKSMTLSAGATMVIVN
jgi:Flp pilus assembly protein TadG